MKLAILIASLAFVACSSKSKTEATDATSAATATAKETTASSTMEVAETPAKAKASAPAAETSSSDGAGFPAITGTEKSSVSCTNKNDTRKITVLNVTEGGCGVVYNKMGEDKTVALAKVDMNYCDTVSSKIKSNLEGSGFSCGGEGASSDTGNQ